jgi:hypothetical protein
MSIEDVAGFLAALASAAEPVDVHFMWRPQLADPPDEIVLEAAVKVELLPLSYTMFVTFCRQHATTR